MKYLFILCLIAGANATLAQNRYYAYIKDKESGQPIINAAVRIAGTTLGNISDYNGLVVIDQVPNGRYAIHFALQNYAPRTDTVSFPLAASDTPVVYMEPDEQEMEEVVISSTRSSRTIQDIPTRVELIGGEELDEKANMKPGDLRMLLGESTGIQTVQTSVTSGNAAIRIEGLDGRYTQILKDGFPLYTGYSGGLGLLQTPPLDLKRVEIIKGASSTLYGGGAIAGLINLISKTPGTTPEWRFLVNGTSARGLDINGFFGQKSGKVGLTVYAAYNANGAYAPGAQVFTSIPQFSRYTINPRLFLYLSPKTEVVIGINATQEHRLGGDIWYVDGNKDTSHTYYERNNTDRASSEFSLTHRFSEHNSLVVRNSLSYFNRIISTPGYTFSGTQNGSFSEVSYSSSHTGSEWVAGANVLTDAFMEIRHSAAPLRNYQLTTLGAFIQYTHDFGQLVTLESGLRGDHISDYGFAVLPRLSMLFKLSKHWSSRIGGGLGYKAPTIFTEETERILYRNLLPVSTDKNELERSMGVNGDINYKTSFADNRITFSINQLFFYTRVDHPLLLKAVANGGYELQSLQPHLEARGTETNIKLGYKHFKLFLGYTFTHSHIHKDEYYAEMTLTPRHHTNSVLMYEIESKWKLGLEAYYYSPQRLSDGTTGHGYWLCGFMAERIWKHWGLYINFENMLNVRQTNYGSIYTGPVTNPVFKDIYAPLDGFVVNGGIKINL